MRRGRFLARLGLILVFGTFLAGLFQVFGLQFRGGMTYPEGSTLRADPLGTMILFESLEAVPGVRARRLLDPLHRLDSGPEGVTLVVLNVHRDLVRHKALVEFVEAGGRVVFQPRAVAERRRRNDEEKDGEEEENEEAQPGGHMALMWEENLIQADLSLVPYLRVRPRRIAKDGLAVRARSETDGPAWTPWPEGRVFEPSGGNRQDVEVLYRANEGPVALGVREGEGEWLLLSDNLTFLNRAMFGEFQTEWLLWTLGGREEVVFWEYPLGIRQPRGIMTLIRQYRLTPLLGVMLVVLLLWIWRGAVPLLPVLGEHEEPERGAQSRLDGLRDLLRRYVPGDSILPRCLEEWRSDLSRTAANPERLAPLWETEDRAARAPLPKRNRGPVLRERFLTLHEHLNPKRTKR